METSAVSGAARARATKSAGAFDAEWLDRACERGILGLVLAILTFGPIATGGTSKGQFLTLLGLGTLIVPLWITRIWLRKQYRFLVPPFAWTVLAFAGYAIWRYMQADIEYNARLELLQVLLYALLFFAVLDNLTRQESIQIILFALIGLAVLNSFYAIFQFFTDSKYVLWYDKPPSYKGRASGTYICPNHLAGFLEMVLPVALACTITGRFKPLPKVFLGYAALMILAGIGVSVSRGGYIATAAALAALFLILLWNRDFRLPALALLVLLVVAGSFFGFRSIQSQKRMSQLAQDEDRKTNVRIHYWVPAMEMWKENFWFGVGAGHYDWRFRKWRHWQMQGRPLYAHNDYLNTLAEYGTIGGGIVGISLLALAWGVARTWKYLRRTNEIATKPSNRAAIVLGCSIGLFAILIHSFGDFNMHIPANAMVAVVFMAIIVSHWRFATERYWLNPGIVGRLSLTLLLLAAAGYFGWQISRIVPQTYALRNYDKIMTLQESLETLERAHRFDPQNDAIVLAIGESYRRKGFRGDEGYEDDLRAAIPWLEKSLTLNKWNPYAHMNLGMCYAWLKEPGKSKEHFEKMIALDPEGYYPVLMWGWHKLNQGDLQQAHKYIKLSAAYNWWDNPDAQKYLEIVERRLAEQPITQ